MREPKTDNDMVQVMVEYDRNYPRHAPWETLAKLAREFAPSTHATLMRRFADGGIEAAVFTQGSPVRVVCVRAAKADVWTPVCGVRGADRIELPSCFELDDDAVSALDALRERATA